METIEIAVLIIGLIVAGIVAVSIGAGYYAWKDSREHVPDAVQWVDE